MKTPTKTKLYQCIECKANYAYKTNLRRHVKEQHKDKVQELAPFLYKYKFSAHFRYTCNECGRNFNQTKHINYHMKKYHPGKSNDKKSPENNVKKKKCPFCDYRDSLRSKLINHFGKNHNIEVKQIELELSREEFAKWKENIELNSNCRFVQECSQSLSGKSRIVRRYICHRSGDYVSTGKGLRNLKKQGSCKMNAFCPAAIKVSYEMNSPMFKINYIETHVGHTSDLEHLTLTSDQRRLIAAKIESKIPFDQILDEFRDSSTSALHRIDLLNRKDLLNIRNSIRQSSNSESNSLDWINAIKHVKFMFYKPSKAFCKKAPNMNNDDFLLILMNPIQQELMKNSANDLRFCMDNWIKDDLRLEALILLDNIGQGFPCSFLITSQINFSLDVIKLFFQCIKEWVGLIECSVFLADLDEDYFLAFYEVMGSQPKTKFFCSWHIDRVSRKILEKVKDVEKQALILDKLLFLLKQKDIAAFHNALDNFQSILSSHNVKEELSDFAHFFDTTLVASIESWAQCFQINSGIDTSLHLEHLHHTIANLFEGSSNFDEIINSLMKFSRDNLFSRLTLNSKEQMSRQLKNVRARHQGSLKLSSNLVSANENIGWDIKCIASQQTYHIEEVNYNCKCELLCSECQVCPHWYSCSCIDSTIKWNMCKHIHLLCRWRKEQKFLRDEVSINDCLNLNSSDYLQTKIDDIPIVFEGLDEESLTIMAEVSEEMFRQKKQELAERFIAIINNISLLDELSIIEKCVAKMEIDLKNFKNEP